MLDSIYLNTLVGPIQLKLLDLMDTNMVGKSSCPKSFWFKSHHVIIYWICVNCYLNLLCVCVFGSGHVANPLVLHVMSYRTLRNFFPVWIIPELLFDTCSLTTQITFIDVRVFMLGMQVLFIKPAKRKKWYL